MNKYRSLFPVLERFTFLNHAGMSPFSTNVAAGMAETAHLILENGSIAGSRLEGLLSSTRAEIGKMMNAPAKNISFVKNTTDGIALIAAGAELSAGDNVVVPECEYPSNIYSWLLLKEKGVNVKFIPCKKGTFTEADVLKTVDGRTRMVALSYSQFFNGFRAPVKDLQKELSPKGILVVVDGVQAAGALNVNIEREGIECFVAGAHKWLLGPPGIGFMFLSPKWYELIDARRLGWASMVRADDKVDQNMRLHKDARRFEDGTYNFIGIAGMKAAAALMNEIGMEHVEEAVLRIAVELRTALKLIGARFAVNEEVASRTPIVSFKLPGIKSLDVALQLASDRVIVKERRGYVRVSPHFYNNSEDIQALMGSVSKLNKV